MDIFKVQSRKQKKEKKMSNRSFPSTIWDVYPRLTRNQVAEFQQAGISYPHAQLLYNRGIRTVEAMRRFIEARFDQIPGPLMLIDMDRALERIQHALATREHITVFGDFDADGVTSAALMVRALRKLKHPDALLDFYIPHRTQDARGLSRDALEQIKSRGTSLVITTDCGSSDVETAAYAQQTLGIDLIITDHHQPPALLPQATALINPWRPDCTYPERYLCGVGVAFKLVQALFGTVHREQEVQGLLDLVAIGTVADVAQLLGENHTLVRLGLQQLNQTEHIGLQALVQVSGLHLGRIRERDIAFGLAPRLNAAGRMKHADIALRLLVTDDRDEALALAWELEELNRLRKEQTNRLHAQARKQAQSQASEPVVLVCGGQDVYPEGIIGLVAGKLAEEVERPVFVLSMGSMTSRGSARSYGGLNIIEALQACADLFVHYGGHVQAAGFTIANSNIEALRQHLLTWYARSAPASADAAPGTKVVNRPGSAIEQVYPLRDSRRMIDLIIARPQALDYAAYASIDQLSPFGAGNLEPVFRMNNLRLTRCWASGPDGNTLQVRLQSGSTQLKGSCKGDGTNIACFEVGSLVNVILCLVPALKAEWEESRDIWLQILHIEAVTGEA
jgi:single-stranded-DNA-specific exonuclease